MWVKTAQHRAHNLALVLAVSRGSQVPSDLNTPVCHKAWISPFHGGPPPASCLLQQVLKLQASGS